MEKKTNPIIIKVSSVFDKYTILKFAKNLKHFNSIQADSSERDCSPYTDTYITEHLPKILYLHNKKLH